jgi:hypothetical protein
MTSVAYGMCKVTFNMYQGALASFLNVERLNANIKLTLHKALIRSVMTYACPTWKFAAETYLLKLQCLQNKVLPTTGSFPRR